MKRALITSLALGAALLVLLAQQPSVPVRDLQAGGAPTMPCVTGQRYFRTDAAAGQNLYVCVAGKWSTVLPPATVTARNYNVLLTWSPATSTYPLPADVTTQTLQVWRNGLLQFPGGDYAAEAGKLVPKLDWADPAIDRATEIVLVSYNPVQ